MIKNSSLFGCKEKQGITIKIPIPTLNLFQVNKVDI